MNAIQVPLGISDEAQARGGNEIHVLQHFRQNFNKERAPTTNVPTLFGELFGVGDEHAGEAEASQIGAGYDASNTDDQVEIFFDALGVPPGPGNVSRRVGEGVSEEQVSRLYHHQWHLQLDVASREPFGTRLDVAKENGFAPTRGV